MGELVVIAAPSGPLDGVLDILIDWSAVGLIDPFAWITESMISESQIGAISVAGGELTGTSLETLVTSARAQQIRVLALVPVFGDATAMSLGAEQRVAEFLEANGGGTRVSRIRAAIIRGGDAATTPDLAAVGWHNVLISPERSLAPGLGHSLVSGDDLGQLTGHVASTVAGLVGLWTSTEGAPLDDVDILPGVSVRLARSFYRRLQSDGLERELREKVTATSDALPLPVGTGPASVHVEDTALATSTMAGALWARYPEVLKGPREARGTSAAKPIGALAAIRLFLGFLGASIRNAPQQWYRTTVVKVSSRVAGTVNDAIFGKEPAAYAVVVNNVTADGLPATWLDLGAAVDSIDAVLEQPGDKREHQARVDLSALWNDYAQAALTLADGADRVKGLEPVVIGTQTAVLRTAALCVPSPASRFDGLPGHVAAEVQVERVDAFDVLAINNLHQRLVSVQNGDAGLGLDAGRSADALQTWTTQHKASFAVQVGSTLARALNVATGEVKSILDALKAASDAETVSNAATAKQKKLARVLRVFAAVFVGILVVVGIVLGLGKITLLIAGFIALGAFVAWLFASFVAFFRGQRELFRLLNARQDLVAQAEIHRRNLRQAIRDVRRLTDAYSQYLAWSRVLGTMLAAPLGSDSAAVEDGTRLSPNLPLNVVLGSAVVDEAAMSNAVVVLRREIFRIGWLTDPWDALIAAAASAIGPEAYELRDEPTAIFRQPGAGENSLLARWSEVLEEKGVGSEVADRMWDEVRQQLDGPRREIAASLLGSIVQLGKTAALKQPFADFMSHVDDPDAVAAGGRFDLNSLTAQGKAGTGAAVDRTWGSQQRRGLSLVAVLTQLSGGAAPYDYTAFRPGSAPQSTAGTGAADTADSKDIVF